jgi:hypothetical protein
MLAFLRSPFTEIDTRPMPRQWRRREGELNKADQDRLVHVVKLRRAAQEAQDAYDAEPVQWKHKWWVAGHFRSQWYPSKKSHDVIWIGPYLKGPDGAPMLEKIYRVER